MSEESVVSVELSKKEAQVCIDALKGWANSRMKIARRRDHAERHLTGVSVEEALGDFIGICQDAIAKIVSARGPV